ncbi:MAG: RraA family protein [Acidimicrobiia bacterium]|nr:RraA family protein [Acidimicrobiia bacterium]MYC44487.1 RraA family protein [Acidimicrobiia bacterium]MYI19024.1 RraA family protein [Acidimicrobiia bacterium]
MNAGPEAVAVNRRIREQLHTAVVGDVLDALGRRHQFLPPAIRPLDPELVLVGRAMPVLVADVFGPQARPFGALTAALDALGPDDVYVARGARTPCAGWGEILTAVAQRNGASGAVIDGYHRDTKLVLDRGFPIFSRGAYGQDAGMRSSVQDFGVAIEIGAVRIAPGDLVIGDRDGVVIVPTDIEGEVIERALEKVATESLVLKDIENGMTATEAFEQYGVL